MRILIAGNVEYRIPNAARFRVESVVEVMRQLGHRIDVFEGLAFDERPLSGQVSAVRYYAACLPRNWVQWWQAKIGIGFRLLNAAIRRDHYDIVYCYGSHLSWLYACRRVARSSRARFIVDVTEFYGLENMLQSFSAFRSRLGSWLGILLFIPLFADGIAVPSRRFRHLFQLLGHRAHLLPPFFCDMAPHDPSNFDDRTLKLVYAGQPSNKERLPLLFQTLAMLDVPNGKKIVLRLAGIDHHEVARIAGTAGVAELLSRQNMLVEGLGHMDVDKARVEVSSADFSIAIRPTSFRVNYGFPSKVAESLCLGTPVICNAYSDIAYYLKDGRDCVLLQQDCASSLRDILASCLAMGKSERDAMRTNAMATGRKCFSADAVKQVVVDLLTNSNGRYD
ncbi:MAG: hypothetical protein RB191_00040 [Terriglobia bacterium]|nr:hypothetical protein [Terriglobia bacterium]